MNIKEKRLLNQLINGKITLEIFQEKSGIDLRIDKKYVIDALKNAKTTQLDATIDLMYLSGIDEQFVDILNELLLNPHHHRHQFVVKCIQNIKHMNSVPFLKKALATGFDSLAYTGSESAVIAKWFSWALFAIGTQEAKAVLAEFAESADAGIQKEMRYRLAKWVEK
jgi:hypothetical protein